MVAMSESSLRKTRSQQRRGGRGAERDVTLRLVRERAADVADRVISGTRDVKEQVMQKAADLTRAVSEGVKEEAERFFDEQKGRLGTKVDRVAKVINQAAHALHAVKADGVAEVVDAAAERVGQASSYLEERSLSQLFGDAEDVARRHPGLLLGGLFVTGLVAARFAKASASRDEAGGGRAGGEGSRGSTRHGRNGRAVKRR